MDFVEEKKFQNSKELLDACIEKVNENQNGLVGGNVALYPTIIIMLGEKSKAYTKYVKETLDDNWNNSRFLKYVCFEKNDGGWSSYVLTENDRRKDIIWQHTDQTTEVVFSKSIIEMLGKEKIFQDRSFIKMDFIMDATEQNGIDYYNLYLEMKHGLQNAELKTFYLMMNQDPNDGKKSTSEKMLKVLLQKQKEMKGKFGTTYILSNFLASGGCLEENEIWKNYRLVADIILLGGNKASDRGYISNLYNGIKTASYVLLKKPTDEIVFTSLFNLIEKMKKCEKERYSMELSEQAIRERLGINGRQEILQLETVFKEKIVRKLPSSDDLQYLPVRSEKTLKELQKMMSVTEQAADSCTMGVWSLFVQKKYMDKVKLYLINDDEIEFISNKIKEMLYTNFSYFEILKMIPKKELLKQMLMEELKFKGVTESMDYKEQLHERAVYECKKYFYTTVKTILIDEFERMLNQAEDYEKLYHACFMELSQEKMIISSENNSIEIFYAEEVNKYVQKHQDINTMKSAFPMVFDILLTKEGLLSSFWKAFLDLIQEEIYECDFEKELNFRMGNMTEEQRQVYVRDKLQANLEDNIRLRSFMNVWTKSCRFYLINNRANYAKNLANLDGNGREFMLFNLNRTDCIEQIEIYNITNPEGLLIHSGEIQNDNKGI